uniref:Glutathione synthetase n=1 Tax=Strigamia maritima TaxID=126957 RepID=T1J555_STRMM
MQFRYTLKNLCKCGSKVCNWRTCTKISTQNQSCIHNIHNCVMEPCIPLPLKDDVLTELTQKAKDWALLHGIGMRSSKDINKDTIQLAPFVLLPSTFSKKEFDKAKVAQVLMNEIIHKAAHSYNFLKQCLSGTVEVDPFTAELFRIYETVRREGLAQSLSLGLIRSDYMLDTINESCLKQVEINTIAAGFGWMGPISSKLHRYVLHELGIPDIENHIPRNNALRGLSEAINFAWKLYGSPNAVLLVIVEEQTYNLCDQRMLEFDVRELNNAIRVIRRTFRNIASNGKLKDKRLFIDEMEVAVAYYRTGYSPDDYKSYQAWDARMLIERSKAIKCPSIQYHLAGTKKVQQELNRKGVLESFLSNSEHIDRVRSLFTGLYSLDMNEEGDEIIKMAIDNPSKYVLKPQREGGGNNFYDKDVRIMLRKMETSEERNAYILMDLISPPAVLNYIIAPGSPPELCKVVGELGVFGATIGSDKEIFYNEEVGHLLRTKRFNIREGGVVAGFAALDSVFLV